MIAALSLPLDIVLVVEYIYVMMSEYTVLGAIVIVLSANLEVCVKPDISFETSDPIAVKVLWVWDTKFVCILKIDDTFMKLSVAVDVQFMVTVVKGTGDALG